MTERPKTLRHYNIARVRYPLDSPEMAEFNANLDRLNRLAERMPGFVWRYQAANGNSTGVQLYRDARIIPNLSVWHTLDDLTHFAFKTVHLRFFIKGKTWFTDGLDAAHTPESCLWWDDAAHLPTPEEARDRFAQFQANGPTASVFSFHHPFDAKGCARPPVTLPQRPLAGDDLSEALIL